MVTNETTSFFLELEDQYQIPSYPKWPVTLVEGKGCSVFDATGKEYLDFYGGHCVAILGHAHPGWVSSMMQQAEKLAFYSNIAGNDMRAIYQQRLVEFAPDQLSRLFLCNSGSEANENAVKLAISATGRQKILCVQGGFHGRTAGALSMTTLGGYRDQFPSLVHEIEAVEFGDIESLSNALTSETAALILEPIQSMNGVKLAAPDYYPEVVKVCHDNGTLVIFDEVQTGMGRVGASFACDRFNARVDIVTAAKGIANGFPLGAVLATEEVSMSLSMGELGSTFGGGPMSCAAGLAVLEAIENENLMSRALLMEDVARSTLVTGPIVGVRGCGLLLGLETNVPAREVVKHLFHQNIMTGVSSDPHVLRLMPPLTIEAPAFEQLAEALEKFVSEPS